MTRHVVGYSSNSNGERRVGTRRFNTTLIKIVFCLLNELLENFVRVLNDVYYIDYSQLLHTGCYAADKKVSDSAEHSGILECFLTKIHME